VENFVTLPIRQSLNSDCMDGRCDAPKGSVAITNRGTAMTVKVDRIEPNIFPTVEYVDARDSGRNAELIFGVKIEGRVIPVTIKISYEEADALAILLEPFNADRATAPGAPCPRPRRS
jgi:hypothetical protein